MKTQIKILAVSTLSLVGLIFSITANSATIPENHCLADHNSKRYLDKEFSVDYPRSANFRCKYICNVNGRNETVAAVSSVVVNNMEEDARLMVCKGVKVKKVPWGYEYDGEDAFYAFDSNMKELKQFAFDNIDQKNKTEIQYLNHLKESLIIVSTAYQYTDYPYFVEAAKILTKMANQLPNNTKLLDAYIEKYIALNGEIPDELDAEYLVLTNILAHAAWRIPSHLLK